MGMSHAAVLMAIVCTSDPPLRKRTLTILGHIIHRCLRGLPALEDQDVIDGSYTSIQPPVFSKRIRITRYIPRAPTARILRFGFLRLASWSAALAWRRRISRSGSPTPVGPHRRAF